MMSSTIIGPYDGKRKLRRNVLGITHSLSMRSLTNGVLCVCVGVFALLGPLVLAESARAASPPTKSARAARGPVALVTESAPESAPEPAPEAGMPVTEPAPEPTPESGPPVAPVTEPAPEPQPAPESGAPVAPVTEPAPEPAPEAAPEPAPEAAPESGAPVVPITEHASEAEEPVAPVTESPPEAPVELIKEKVKEAASGESVTEQAAESSPSPPTAGAQAAATLADPSNPTEAEASSAVLGLLIAVTPGGELEEPSTTSASSAVAIDTLTRLTPAQRAGDLRCELSGLAGPMTDNCTASWLGDQSFLSASPAELATVVAARAGAPAGGDNDGSGGDDGDGGHSVVPPSAPAPSGAFGGSATGGSGIALSSFSTLADRLMRLAPLAMRRLRLSCKPWLTAFFVLIPERPG
jgi:hypothetical protein